VPQCYKKIGGLSVQDRKDKIQKYLEKKKSRKWSKQISYECRKIVADDRLRIKGRFVNKEMAQKQLPNIDLEKLSPSAIKHLLQIKLQKKRFLKSSFEHLNLIEI